MRADSLFADSSFRLFWLARLISISGSTMTAVVLPILVYQITGSALQTSLLTSIEVLPYFVFGLVAGALADRVDRRKLMIACNLIQAVLAASIPLAAFFGILRLSQIYGVALLSMTALVWFDAANFGALPAIVGRKRIVEANSLIWSSTTIIGVLAPAVGGSLAAVVGAANVIAVESVGFIGSALLLARIPRPFNLLSAAADLGQSLVQRTLSDICEGLQFLWQQTLVRTLTLVGFGNSFSGGAVLGLMVVYAVQALGMAENDARIGLLYTATAVGGLTASLLLPYIVRRFSVGQITLASLGFGLLLMLAIAIAPGLWFGIAAIGLWQICNMLVIINGIALRQQVTPDHLQARVNMTARMVAWGGQPFGAAVGGALADAYDVRTALALVSGGIVISLVLGWFSPLRTHRDPLLTDEATVS